MLKLECSGFFYLHFMPHIRYQLNKSLDKKMALVFLNIKAGGIDFVNGIVNVHKELENITQKTSATKKKMINNHFDYFYQKHKKYLRGQVKKFQAEWNKKEKLYFKEVAKIFRGELWPKGKYFGYISIIDCNPRFLSDRTFQIFYYQPQGAIYTTCHELTHFIFYDYCLKKYPDIFKKLNTEQGIFWDLAEIFNTVVLALPQFVAIHGHKKIAIYPEHKKAIVVLKKYWLKDKDIDKWISRSFKYLSAKS